MLKYVNNKWFKLTIVFIFVILLPLALTFILYPLKEIVIFDGKKYQQSEFAVINILPLQNEPTFINLIADALSTPLYLNWYKIIIRNNSIQQIPGCLESEPSVVKFSFQEGDPRMYFNNIKEGKVNSAFGNFESKYPDYYIKSGEGIYFIASPKDVFSINGGVMFSGECKLQMKNKKLEISKLLFDYTISIKPYLGAWVAKLVIIILFFVFLLSSCISIVKCVKDAK